MVRVAAECAGQCWELGTQTDAGGSWLAARSTGGGAAIDADATALAPGLYTGAITFRDRDFAAQVPVVLVVRAPKVTPLSANPGVLFAWGEQGRRQTFCVEGAGDVPLPVVTTRDGGTWLKVEALTNVRECFAVTLGSVKPGPAFYSGEIRVRAKDQVLTIPVTLVPPAPDSPAVIAGVWNAASIERDAIAAGELVSIRGAGFGPESRILFDGIEAVCEKVSATEMLAVVPEQIQGRSQVTVQIVQGGGTEAAVPVVSAAPGIFTVDGSGRGTASADPARRGEAVSFDATGFLAGARVRVLIGGMEARVTLVEGSDAPLGGRWRVHAVVPEGVAAGPTVSLLVCVDGRCSQRGITLNVE